MRPTRPSLRPPSGFSERPAWGGVLWIRDGWEDRLPLRAPSLEDGFRSVPGAFAYRGRGETWSAPAGAADRAVLRHYRHGGVLAPLTGDVFVGATPRPVIELAVSEELRRRGVRTPEVLALWWRWAGPWIYRADLVTREVAGDDLAAWLRRARGPGRRALLAHVGRALAAVHQAGLRHPDLNMKNLLVTSAPTPEIWILDLDRASVGAPLGEAERLSQLKRLERSFRKLSRGQPLATEAEALAVVRAYFGRTWRAEARRHWSAR